MPECVIVVSRVEAAELDQPYLPASHWDAIPEVTLVRADDGEQAALNTCLRTAWSDRGLHLRFECLDSIPITRAQEDKIPSSAEESVVVFIDPIGERGEYMAFTVTPDERVRQARIEDPLQHAIRSEVDTSWTCPGLRVRVTGEETRWLVELFIPFAGMTPVIDPPHPGNRWTGNFYRIEHDPIVEISAWQPVFTRPPDLYAADRFGILEFGSYPQMTF